ncbi:MAG TPA: bifunctional diaminohydroxyphosphoribosylaminopyrimidine deaminase/5-amino-6-(5-phosphoribosylamino)uracil reductase RibD [Bauldia sp.]|nr:bifunctional diaminohydroxyphosphoribosylaminopyrimidine deaminase/5-amino-6-(5-phosphoribosylamino)uracil reductase RibD [Bauldia sp.]
MARAAKVPVDAEFDRRIMAAALRIGRRNLGQTYPNPAVGCVLVQTVGGERIVVGHGWTAVGGRPHAEAAALANAGAAAKGATAYVTLEPCAHQGRAGPCADALIAAGVSRVVTAMVDPDPRTAGDGHAKLEAAGIAVTTNVLAEDAARAHSGHIARMTKGRPHMTLKLAVSADGMIGRREGERMIVTGKPAFEAVQIMRTEFDAVLVGIGTVLVDDPLLTVRLPGLARRSPVRVILDKDARLPPTARLLQSIEEARLIVYVGPEAPSERVAALVASGAEIVPVPLANAGVDLAAVLADLAEKGFTRVLAEGGAEVASSLVSADLLDEVILFRASVVVGPDGVRALGGMALSAIERSPRYRQIEAGKVGEDIMRRYVRAA